MKLWRREDTKKERKRHTHFFLGGGEISRVSRCLIACQNVLSTDSFSSAKCVSISLFFFGTLGNSFLRYAFRMVFSTGERGGRRRKKLLGTVC